MQLAVNLDTLLEAEDETIPSLANRLAIDVQHLRKIYSGGFSAISRYELQSLLTWAATKDAPLFILRRHPALETFTHDQPALIFSPRGHSAAVRSADIRLDGDLVEFLGREIGAQAQFPTAHSHKRVRRLLKTHNCIFHGGPRHNLATESAICALWNAEPFVAPRDDPRENHVPFGITWPEGFQPSSESAFDRPFPAPTLGVTLNSTLFPDGPNHFKADYWSDDDAYFNAHGVFRDCGVLIVCRRPLGTQQDVTTIILAGYSGPSTLDMGSQIMSELCPMDPSDLEPYGSPLLAIRETGFRTTRGTSVRSLRRRGTRWAKFYPAGSA